MDNIEIKEKILANVYKIIDKRGRSKIWECFGFIKDENDVEITNFVACKMCKNVYKYNKNALSNLNKHKCYTILKNDEHCELIEPNQETKKACLDALTEWFSGDLRPYSVAQDKGLKTYTSFILSVGNKFGANINTDTLIAHPSTIKRNVDGIYSIHFSNLNSEMKSIKNIGYALKCDLWTENFSHISYLAVTAHYIVDGVLKSKLLGIKSMKGISNTSK